MDIGTCPTQFLSDNFDLCSTGLEDSKGAPMRTPTEVSANDDHLLIPFKKHKCDGSHEPSQIACN